MGLVEKFNALPQDTQHTINFVVGFVFVVGVATVAVCAMIIATGMYFPNP